MVWWNKRSFFELDFMEGVYKKIEIAGMIYYKISISTKIQEILPENLKN